jgi:6-phosphogluconate dehydrogenase
MGDNNIGVYGLSVMGQNLALNIGSKGFKVAVANRSPARVDETVIRAKNEDVPTLSGYKSNEEFVKSLMKPRMVIILVQAGKAVDLTIKGLAEHMEEGDIIIDGGNEWFPNQERRYEELKAKKIQFIGMGVSGGEEGARNGPSLMPGCDKEAWESVKPIAEKIAAQIESDHSACVAYLGPIGAGNYVKMVHNGIEYGDMQLIAEAYDILRIAGKLSNAELAKAFGDWNKGDLESFLIEITAIILDKKDDQPGKDGYLVDKILDQTGMKGTGRWTIQEAAERSVNACTLAASLDMRYQSGLKEERMEASKVLQGPAEIPAIDKAQLIDDVGKALYASKVCSYAQGLCLIKAAYEQKGWGDAPLGDCASIWRGGCIIRAQFLDRIKKAFETNPKLANLMVDPDFAAELNSRQYAWRRVVTLAIASGITCPAFAASINYFDSYRRANLPANVTQAQRDFFGGHSYKRSDMEGDFHTQWTAAHASLGDISTRNDGNL